MPFSFNLGQPVMTDIPAPFDDYMSLVTGGRLSQSATDPFAGLASQGVLGTGQPGETSDVGVLFDDVSRTLMKPASGLDTFLQPSGPDAGLRAQIAGALSLSGLSGSVTAHLRADDGQNGYTFTYAGADVRVMIEVPNPDNPTAERMREFLELSTISISIYRVKSPVRACGYINPKGFARGTRTIAGTLVLTQFTLDVLYRFLFTAARPSSIDISKDSWYKKPDQLPPFNLTMVFADEYGNESYRRLLGVDMVNDGTVYSVNDLYAEQTISYMAADFTPLVPVGGESTWTRWQAIPEDDDDLSLPPKTPMNVLQKVSKN